MPNVKHLLLLGNLADSFPPLVAIIDRCELVGTKEGYEFQFHAVKMTVSIAVCQISSRKVSDPYPGSDSAMSINIFLNSLISVLGDTLTSKPAHAS